MDELVLAAEKAAKDAKRALVLVMLAVSVAVIVLVIDNGIKKSVIEEASKARLIIEEFRITAGEASGGGQGQVRAAEGSAEAAHHARGGSRNRGAVRDRPAADERPGLPDAPADAAG